MVMGQVSIQVLFELTKTFFPSLRDVNRGVCVWVVHSKRGDVLDVVSVVCLQWSFNPRIILQQGIIFFFASSFWRQRLFIPSNSIEIKRRNISKKKDPSFMYTSEKARIFKKVNG